MSVRAGSAVVDFEGRFDGLTREVNSRVGGMKSTFSSAFKGIAAAAGGIFAGTKIVSFFGDSIDEAREAAKVTGLTNAVIKSTGGIADITADQVGNLANKLSLVAGVDDELVQAGENVLLTFTNVRNGVGKGNDIFDQATSAAVDLSSALGQDLQSSVVQIGKALNDPIKGVTALSRVGVSFTEQQKDQIKTLVDSGRTLDAQKIILKELRTEFGGAAAAAASPADKFKVAWANVKESVGTALLPVLNGLLSWLAVRLPGAVQTAGAALSSVAAGARPILNGIGAVVDLFTGRFAPILAGIAAGAAVLAAGLAGPLVAAWVASKIAAIQAAIAFVAANLPLIAISAAVAAVAAGVIYAYTHFKVFHDVVDAVGRFLRDQLWPTIQGIADVIAAVFGTMVNAASSVISFVRDHWQLLLAILTGPIGAAVIFITSHFDQLVGFVTGLPGRIVGAASGMWDGIKDAFKSALNWIIGKWNGLEFKLPTIDTHIPGIGKVGGFTLGTPDIPKLHTGGTFHAGTSGGEGLALLKDDELVLTTQQQALLTGSAGDTYQITVSLPNYLGDDRERIAQELAEPLAAALNDHARARS